MFCAIKAREGGSRATMPFILLPATSTGVGLRHSTDSLSLDSIQIIYSLLFIFFVLLCFPMSRLSLHLIYLTYTKRPIIQTFFIYHVGEIGHFSMIVTYLCDDYNISECAFIYIPKFLEIYIWDFPIFPKRAKWFVYAGEPPISVNTLLVCG